MLNHGNHEVLLPHVAMDKNDYGMYFPKINENRLKTFTFLLPVSCVILTISLFVPLTQSWMAQVHMCCKTNATPLLLLLLNTNTQSFVFSQTYAVKS